MLKISEPAVNHVIVLKLEGRLIGPWVAELRSACETRRQNGQQVQLDIAEVTFADRNGISLLRQLKAGGVEFLNCSPFLAEELKASDP